MPTNQLRLLKIKRFLPLFMVQFLGAFNDNIYRNALIIFLAYQTTHFSISQQELLVTAATGIFILPFFLFSATAGELADKFSKSALIILVKLFEIACMVIGAVGFYFKNISTLFAALFLMGTHSAFFGPLKYAILPEQLQKQELIGGNALIEAGTFVAILLGTILGGVLIIKTQGPMLVASTTLIIACTGWIISFFIPRTYSIQPNLKINYNFIKESFYLIKSTKAEKEVFASIIGISWFWLVGATFLTQFPSFAKNTLNTDAQIVILFFTTFSLGVAIGALLCNKILKSKISTKYTFISALIISLFIFDLCNASRSIMHTSTLMTLADFLKSFNSWRIIIDILLLSIGGGLYTVPLYTVIQTRTAAKHRARTIACNNILNALFMVIASIVCMILLKLSFNVIQIFLGIAFINLLMVFYFLSNFRN